MGVASHAGHAAGPYDGMYLGSARRGGRYLHHDSGSTRRSNSLWCGIICRCVTCGGKVVLKPTRPIRPAVCKPRCSLYQCAGLAPSIFRGVSRELPTFDPPQQEGFFTVSEMPRGMCMQGLTLRANVRHPRAWGVDTRLPLPPVHVYHALQGSGRGITISPCTSPASDQLDTHPHRSPSIVSLLSLSILSDSSHPSALPPASKVIHRSNPLVLEPRPLPSNLYVAYLHLFSMSAYIYSLLGTPVVSGLYRAALYCKHVLIMMYIGSKGCNNTMRVLDTYTGQLVDINPRDRAKKYAILSHTWDLEGEQTYGELRAIQQQYTTNRPSVPSNPQTVPITSHISQPPSVNHSPNTPPERHSPNLELSPIWDDPKLSPKIREACRIAREHGYR